MFRRVWAWTCQLTEQSKTIKKKGVASSRRDIAIESLQVPQIADQSLAPTFKLDTRSAVSSRLNWLIWSTIVVILGFVGAAAAASVDSHRRLLGVRAVGRYVVAMRREDGRTEPESCLQQRAAAWVEKDMAGSRIRSSKR